MVASVGLYLAMAAKETKDTGNGVQAHKLYSHLISPVSATTQVKDFNWSRVLAIARLL